MSGTSLQNRMNYELILDIILLLFGILLLITPAKGLVVFIWVLAIALLGSGVVCGVIAVWKRVGGPALLAYAIAAIVLGILIIAFRESMVTVILPALIGVWMLVSAVMCIYAALQYNRAGAALWWLPLVAALIAIIVACLIFFNLHGTTVFIGRVIGIYFIVYNAIRVGEYFTVRRALK